MYIIIAAESLGSETSMNIASSRSSIISSKSVEPSMRSPSVMPSKRSYIMSPSSALKRSVMYMAYTPDIGSSMRSPSVMYVAIILPYTSFPSSSVYHPQ